MNAAIIKGEAIRVTGIVQGVGFRPTVWKLAHQADLVGQVWNDSEGVLIHVWGDEDNLSDFASRLKIEAPSLAKIDHIYRSLLNTDIIPPKDFTIMVSQTGQINTCVAPDATTCPVCLEEIFDPSNRRYRYPFTNCTHCGPRMSIIKGIPYDRVNTSMSDFKMCPICQNEYNDPADRRFHAQPNACHQCGPKVWLEDRQGRRVDEDADCDIIETTSRLIRQGHIVAIKGIGGIHLACDASNRDAVKRLRQRKHRYYKPLALMARDMTMIKLFVKVNKTEETLLSSYAAPIVILQKKNDHHSENQVSSELAPGQNSLGFMLPYTPLHHLLMQNMTWPIVLTSANKSGEPQVTNNEDSHQRLDKIADYYLLHDRDIVNRLDDSVLRVMDGMPRFLRLARGYAPLILNLPDDFPRTYTDKGKGSILSMGGELKNTFSLLKNGKIILSQYIGDLEYSITYQDYQHNLLLYRQFFDFKPTVIAVDKHPDYLSTKWGQQIAIIDDVPLTKVQHHHAHIASCMLEHGLGFNTKNVLGIALDGLGFGDDNTIWGGEFLQVNYQQCKRIGSFQTIRMLGGTKAMYEPWRNTLAYLLNIFNWDKVHENSATIKKYSDLDIICFLKTKPINNLKIMAKNGLNSPNASSAGRLFDAVAAALGICREQVSYEGQAAIELEALASQYFESQAENDYDYEFKNQQIIWTRMWLALLEDLNNKINPGIIAARFHQCVARAVSQTAYSLCRQYKLKTVVLSGGVFQNRLLLERTTSLLREQHLNVISPVLVPMNDAGIAVGQAVVTSALNKIGS